MSIIKIRNMMLKIERFLIRKNEILHSLWSFSVGNIVRSVF
jgi:hypothetical protein